MAAIQAPAGATNTSDQDGDSADGPLPGLTGTSVADSACGSGRLLLSMAGHLDAEQSDSPQQNSVPYWVHGTDIDPVCAKMSVVNLWLHGVPGIIQHGDALTQDIEQAWAVTSDDGSPPYQVLELDG